MEAISPADEFGKLGLWIRCARLRSTTVPPGAMPECVAVLIGSRVCAEFRGHVRSVSQEPLVAKCIMPSGVVIDCD